MIETSPPTTTTTEPAPAEEIKPSRTVILPAVQAKEKVSVVQVLPEAPKPYVVKANAAPPTVKFVQKAVTPVKVKPVAKPKPKVAIVEVTPVKQVEPEEEEEEEPFKVQVIKPTAPIIKVIGAKVEVTTEKEIVTPEPVQEVVPEEEVQEEEEDEEEEEQQDEVQEEEEVKEEESVKEEPAQEEHKEEEVEEEEEEQHEEEVVEDKKEPAKTVEEPTIDAEQKEHSPIVFSSITEENEAEHEDEHDQHDEEEQDEDDEPAPVLQIGNNIAPEPEYDFLSRQPSEFVEETYRVVNLKPTATASQAGAASAAPTKPKGKRGQGNKKPRPTGLVTKLGGTVVKDGATTVHETSVIGTYISGKYAQVLQSTSHVFQGNAAAAAAPAQKGPAPGPKNINPSQTLRILKTAAPNPNKTPRYNAELASIITPSPSHAQALEDTGLPLENLFAAQPASNLVRPSRRLAGPGAGLNGGSFKNRLKNRIGKDDSNDLQERSDQVDEPVGPPVAAAASAPSFGNGKKTNRYRNTQTVKPNNVGKK